MDNAVGCISCMYHDEAEMDSLIFKMRSNIRVGIEDDKIKFKKSHIITCSFKCEHQINICLLFLSRKFNVNSRLHKINIVNTIMK